ncbi:MAG: hypothetical protein ACP5P3_10540 [Ignavibacteria bacterium]
MKLTISTIVVAIFLFLFGWLIYDVILANSLPNMAKFMRPRGDFKWWALIVGMIIEAFLLSFIYMKTFKGVSPFKEGFIFGFVIGLLKSLPYMFYMWASYQVPYKEVVPDAIFMGLTILIAGIIIGLIFGKKPIAETT